MVQWLGLGAFTAVAGVQSLVGELRSCKPHGVAKKIKKRDFFGTKWVVEQREEPLENYV